MKDLKWWHYVLLAVGVPVFIFLGYQYWIRWRVTGKALPAGYTIADGTMRAPDGRAVAFLMLDRYWATLLPASDLDRLAVWTANVNGYGIASVR